MESAGTVSVIAQQRFVCVDQNMFRSDALARMVADTGFAFLVIDAAIMEMCKSPEWESTLRRSLQILSACPDRVHFALGNGELLTMEQRRMQAIAFEDMVDPENTIMLRGLLEEVARDRRGPWMGWLDRTHHGNMARMAAGHLDHERNRQMVLDLIPTIQNALSQTTLRKWRRDGLEDAERIRVVSGITSAIFPVIAENGGVTVEASEQLFNQRSYLTRYLWLRVEAIVRWIETGGAQTMRAERSTNDLVDSHYVLVGSYCDQLLTRDAGPVRADHLLRQALAVGFNWNIDVNDLSVEPNGARDTTSGTTHA